MSFKKILMLGGAVAVMTSGLMMQQAYAVDDTVTTEAYIVTALTMECGASEINFGNLLQGQAGTVTVSPAGARSSTNPAMEVAGMASTAGSCDLVGEALYPFDIDAADDTVANGATTMDVNNFQFDDTIGVLPAGPGPYSAALDGTGNETILIGADLVVAGTEPVGSYTGSVTVTANYQ